MLRNLRILFALFFLVLFHHTARCWEPDLFAKCQFLMEGDNLWFPYFFRFYKRHDPPHREQYWTPHFDGKEDGPFVALTNAVGVHWDGYSAHSYLRFNTTWRQGSEWGHFLPIRDRATDCIVRGRDFYMRVQGKEMLNKYGRATARPPRNEEERLCHITYAPNEFFSHEKQLIPRRDVVTGYAVETYLGSIGSRGKFSDCLQMGSHKKFGADGLPFAAYGLKNIHNCYGYSDGGNITTKHYVWGGTSCVMPKAPCDVIIETKEANRQIVTLKGVPSRTTHPQWFNEDGTLTMMRHKDQLVVYSRGNFKIDPYTGNRRDQVPGFKIKGSEYDFNARCFHEDNVEVKYDDKVVGTLIKASRTVQACRPPTFIRVSTKYVSPKQINTEAKDVKGTNLGKKQYLTECVTAGGGKYSAYAVTQEGNCIGYTGEGVQFVDPAPGVVENPTVVTPYACIMPKPHDAVVEVREQHTSTYLYLNGTHVWRNSAPQWQGKVKEHLTLLSRHGDRVVAFANGLANQTSIAKLPIYGHLALNALHKNEDIIDGAKFVPAFGPKRRSGAIFRVSSDMQKYCRPPVTLTDPRLPNLLTVERHRVVDKRSKSAANPYAEPKYQFLGAGQYLTDCLRYAHTSPISTTHLKPYTAFALRYNGCWGYVGETELVKDTGGYTACVLPPAPAGFILEGADTADTIFSYMRGQNDISHDLPVWRSSPTKGALLVAKHPTEEAFGIYQNKSIPPKSVKDLPGYNLGVLRVGDFNKREKTFPDKLSAFDGTVATSVKAFDPLGLSDLPCKVHYIHNFKGVQTVSKARVVYQAKKLIHDTDYFTVCMRKIKDAGATHQVFKQLPLKGIAIESSVCWAYYGNSQYRVIQDFGGYRYCHIDGEYPLSK